MAENFLFSFIAKQGLPVKLKLLDLGEKNACFFLAGLGFETGHLAGLILLIRSEQESPRCDL